MTDFPMINYDRDLRRAYARFLMDKIYVDNAERMRRLQQDSERRDAPAPAVEYQGDRKSE